VIPDKVVFPAMIISCLYLLFVNPFSLFINLVSAFGAFVFFFALFLITKGKGMGFGDVKLVFLLGLILGFPKIVLALYLAFLTGALSGIILIIWRKKRSLKETIPFGPFLIAGTIISLFLGDLLIPKILVYLGLL
jgi:prepilin signal peptidase PulO-like enzyme (type II secretory pathway)